MRNSFDPETAERLLAGELRPGEAPHGLEDMAELFQALRAPIATTALPGEAATVAAMARAIETAGSVHDVKFAGVQTEALVPHDAAAHDVKASPTDVKRAPAPGDVWVAPAPPIPIRTPVPSPTLDRMAWASERRMSPWRRALQPVLAKSWGERRRPLKARVAALVAAAMLLSTGGAAAAGALPGPLQMVVSKTLRVVGIHVPSGHESGGSTDSPSVAASTAPPDTTPPAAQHGKDVSDTARNTDARGRDHGRAVSEVARDGHGKGPGAEHGAKGGNSEGHRQDGDHSHGSQGQSHRTTDPGSGGPHGSGSGSGSSGDEGDGSSGDGSGGSGSSHSGGADQGRSGSHGSS